MARGDTGTRRTATRRIAARGRVVSPTISAGVVQRGRLGAQEQRRIEEIKKFNREEQKKVDSLVVAINAGKIKNVNQIPERFRSLINVSQSQLNQISSFFAAKKEADLWAQAYKHAEAAISRKNPFIIAFSDNPYIKTAYRELKQNYAAFKERSKQIADIRSGKTTGVEIRGGRIWDTKTGKPITPQKATSRQYVATLQKELGLGEKLIVDKNFNIIGIESARLGQSIKLDKEGIAFYNREINKAPKFSFKEAAEQARLREEAIAQSKIPDAPTLAFLRAQSQKFNSAATNARGRIEVAARNKELSKLANLDRLISSGAGTPADIRERNILRQKAADRFQDMSTWIYSTIARTLTDAGVGSIELYAALKKDPKTTLAALPAAILAVVKDDLNRLGSGDPFNIAEVLLEYATFAKAAQLVGKGSKVAIGIGRTLSPKYFNQIGKRLFIPPTTLRRAAVKTVLGAKVNRAVTLALKNTATAKKFNKYAIDLRRGRLEVARRLSIIESKAKRVSKIAKIKVGKVKINLAYKKSLRDAKKLRIKAGKKGKTLSLTSPDYKTALRNIDSLTDAVAKVKASQFLINYMERGGKLTSKQFNEFVVGVQKHYKKVMSNRLDYKELARLSKQDRFLSVKLIRQGKIKSAKILFNRLLKYLGSLKVVKIMNKFLSMVLRGAKISIRVATKPVRRLKAKVRKKIKKFKSKAQIAKERKAARRLRIKAAKTRRTVVIGNSDYMKAVEFIEDFADNYAKLKAKKFLTSAKKSGKKIGLGQEGDFIRASQRFVRKKLNNIKEFKNLKEAARLNAPFSFELRRVGRLQSAKILFNRLKIRINKLPTLNRLGRLVRAVKRKVSVKRIKKVLKRKLEVRRARAIRKKTIRYQMEKKRPLRKVTLDQLRRSSDVSKMNKFIDAFFKEMQSRQAITVSPVKFSNMKNILKKRMRKAIKSGNREEIRKFGLAVKQVLANMEKKSSQPTVKYKMKPFAEPGKPKPKKFQIKTIPEFETTTPKGTFVEVRSGSTVLLQEVKTKQVQKVKVISVQKKAVDLKPLVKFGVASLSGQILVTMQKSKQPMAKISGQAGALKFLQDSKQDFRVLNDVAQATKTAFTPAIIQTVNSKIRPRVPTKPRPPKAPTKKKKPVRLRLPRAKPTPKKVKKLLGFNVSVKKGSRFMKQNSLPLRLQDAKDLMAYVLDTTPSRTGKIIPVGLVSRVGIIRKNISGYFSKNRRKFRTFRRKDKRKILLVFVWIEKRKYAIDTPREKRLLRRAPRRKRKKVARKKPVKRSPVKRRPTKKKPAKKKPAKRKPLKRRPTTRRRIKRK